MRVVLVVAALLLPSVAFAEVAVEVRAGEKRLDSQFGTHAAGGLVIAGGSDRAQVIAGAIVSQTENAPFGRTESSEYFVGMRVLGRVENLRPFLEAGPMFAELDQKEIDFHDSAPGGWVGAGMLYEIGGLQLGAHARVSRARGKSPMGGTHLGAIIGLKFGGMTYVGDEEDEEEDEDDSKEPPSEPPNE